MKKQIKLKFSRDIETELHVIPKRGTPQSAGYDIIAVSSPEIVGKLDNNGYYEYVDYIQYRTGIHIEPQSDFTYWEDEALVECIHTLIYPRSSISKYNLQLANSIGLCDSDYRGELLVRFNYVWQPMDLKQIIGRNLVGQINMDKIYKKGDKIAQLVGNSTTHLSFEIVDELDKTDRGSGGFGHTG